jgi:hypothetical protein
MKNFKKGQKVRVIADTFKHDPHGLEIGSVHVVESVSPATPFKNFPPLVQLMTMLEGKQPYDLPERIHVRYGEGFHDYANIVFEDVELVTDDGVKVRMLDDDFTDGYKKGDVFTVYEEDGDLWFEDKDGDARLLEGQEYEFI